MVCWTWVCVRCVLDVVRSTYTCPTLSNVCQHKAHIGICRLALRMYASVLMDYVFAIHVVHTLHIAIREGGEGQNTGFAVSRYVWTYNSSLHRHTSNHVQPTPHNVFLRISTFAHLKNTASKKMKVICRGVPCDNASLHSLTS